MNNTTKNNMKNVASLLVGAAIGGGIAYLTYSKKGKKFRKNVGKKAAELNEQVRVQVNHGVETAQDKLSKALNVSKDFVNETTHTVVERLGDLSETIQNRLHIANETIEEGAKIAKSKVKEVKNGAKV